MDENETRPVRPNRPVRGLRGVRGVRKVRPVRGNRGVRPNRGNLSIEPQEAMFDLPAREIDDLRRARDILDDLISDHDSLEMDAESAADGRYLGGNHALALELRVDFDGSGVVSGDLFGLATGRHDYLASFRTAPGKQVSPDTAQPLPIIFEGTGGEVQTGLGLIERSAVSEAVTLTLLVEGAIPGLPANREFELTAEWQSGQIRRIGIELEQEVGTEDPPSFDFNGRQVTYRTVLADAGFEIHDVGQSSHIPAEPGGWGTAQLHALMTDFAAGTLSEPAWRQQLLWLGKSTRSGLFGVMFDSTAHLPRQGTAVFDGEIRATQHTPVERKIIQTTVHEIGHGLNLAHRFEREVGRADSTSFMNYDWRYKGGNRRAEFWSKFDFSFDPDELEFLRHAPRNQVIPGGAAFHSVNYWADGNGGYSPYVPEQQLDILNLQIEAPTAGSVFAFGQPVLLGAELTNLSGDALNLDRRFLDPKTGFLEVLVRRLGSGGGGASHFHPIVERCFDIDPRAAEVVPHGESISDNLNITFGSSGFTFPEPGRYEIQAVVVLFDNGGDNNPFNDRDLIVPSNKLVIHIAHPQDRTEEEEVASTLHRADVGTWFALGGSSALQDAERDLMAVLDRRLYGADEVNDPIAANILRCQGINAGRRYKRFHPDRERKFVSRNGRPEEAATTLERLGKTALDCFDRHTAAATRSLCAKHRERAKTSH